MQKRKLPKRVSIKTAVNGAIALEMRKKSPRASIAKDKKKESSKYAARRNDDFFRILFNFERFALIKLS